MKIQLYAIVIFVISIAMLNGCTKDASAPVQQTPTLQFKYTMNGKIVDHGIGTPYAAHYTETIDGTVVYDGTMVSDENLLNTNDTTLTLCFPSRSTGDWTAVTNARMTCSYGQEVYACGRCAISVTRYGVVNDVVSGSFSGILVSLSDTVTITEGVFTAKRMD
jgi:hypothetical protein